MSRELSFHDQPIEHQTAFLQRPSCKGKWAERVSSGKQALGFLNLCHCCGGVASDRSSGESTFMDQLVKSSAPELLLC